MLSVLMLDAAATVLDVDAALELRLHEARNTVSPMANRMNSSFFTRLLLLAF
jgi:hypothetical protein